MDIGDAKITQILESISNHIVSHEEFKDIPIYWDEAELDPNTISFPCVQLQPLEWKRGKACDYEREFQLRIFSKTKSRRDAIVQLYHYEQLLAEIMDEIIHDPKCAWFELHLLGGSQIAILQYGNKDPDSYKSAKTLYGSVIGLRYDLRY